VFRSALRIQEAADQPAQVWIVADQEQVFMKSIKPADDRGRIRIGPKLLQGTGAIGHLKVGGKKVRRFACPGEWTVPNLRWIEGWVPRNELSEANHAPDSLARERAGAIHVVRLGLAVA